MNPHNRPYMIAEAAKVQYHSVHDADLSGRINIDRVQFITLL